LPNVAKTERRQMKGFRSYFLFGNRNAVLPAHARQNMITSFEHLYSPLLADNQETNKQENKINKCIQISKRLN